MNEAHLIASRENPKTWNWKAKEPGGKKKRVREIPEHLAGQYLYRKSNGKLASANGPWPEGQKSQEPLLFEGLSLKQPNTEVRKRLRVA